MRPSDFLLREFETVFTQDTYTFFFMPFFLKFLGFLPAVIVSSFVQILTERVPF